MAQQLRKARVRFLAKVRVRDGHWVLTSSKAQAPHGWFRLGATVLNGNRAAWLLFRGDIPALQQVLSCMENEGCVNPDHLCLGTASDSAKRGAQKRLVKMRGEGNHAVHLTEADVRRIRELVDQGRLIRELADEYGVSRATVGHAVQGRTWKHLPLGKRASQDGRVVANRRRAQ